MAESANASLLEIRNLHVAYGRVEAVHGISLDVKPGTIVSVIGPNGAGKTTLLAALMGLLPSKGELAYLGTRANAPVGRTACCPRAHPGAGTARALCRDERRRQSPAGRISASALRRARLAGDGMRRSTRAFRA